MPSSAIDESALSKGQVRKLNALRKSVGADIGERAFADWLATHSAGDPEDRNAVQVADALWPLIGKRVAEDPARRLHRETRPRPDRRRAGWVLGRLRRTVGRQRSRVASVSWAGQADSDAAAADPGSGPGQAAGRIYSGGAGPAAHASGAQDGDVYEASRRARGRRTAGRRRSRERSPPRRRRFTTRPGRSGSPWD